MDYNIFLLAKAEQMRRTRELAEHSQYDAMPTAPPSPESHRLQRLLFRVGTWLIGLGSRLKSNNAPIWIEAAEREPGC